jgi:hypothetical protein
MRLYFCQGPRDELPEIARTGAFEELDLGGRRGVLLSCERPLPVLEACIRVDIPDAEVAPFARGPEWPDDYVVPLAIVQEHNGHQHT